jgi:hypothetical protein
MDEVHTPLPEVTYGDNSRPKTKWPIRVTYDTDYPRPWDYNWPNPVRIVTPEDHVIEHDDSIVEISVLSESPDFTTIMEYKQWEKIKHLHLELKQGEVHKDGTCYKLGTFVDNPKSKSKKKFVPIEHLVYSREGHGRSIRHRNGNRLDNRLCNLIRDASPVRSKTIKPELKLSEKNKSGVVGVIREFERSSSRMYFAGTWREQGKNRIGPRHYEVDGEEDAALENAKNDRLAALFRLANLPIPSPLQAADALAKKMNSLKARAPTSEKAKIIPDTWDIKNPSNETFIWVDQFPNPYRPLSDCIVEMAFDKHKKQTIILDSQWLYLTSQFRWVLEQTPATKRRRDGSNDIKVYRWQKLIGETKGVKLLLTDVISNYHSSYGPPHHLNGNVFDFRLENLDQCRKENSAFIPESKSGYYGLIKGENTETHQAYFRVRWTDNDGVDHRGDPFYFDKTDGESEDKAAIAALKRRSEILFEMRRQRAAPYNPSTL